MWVASGPFDVHGDGAGRLLDVRMGDAVVPDGETWRDFMSREDVWLITMLLMFANGVFNGTFFRPEDLQEGNVLEVRRGEFAASGMVLSAAVLLTWSTKSKAPLYVAAMVCAVYITWFEYKMKASNS